eukprot:CAMPEP_0174894792 /NCGR_PEP_ID=MMETSP0167-20121228/9341_1 /TAXON_ID=38298 /ORGANISM="Rhodella maculata, Strain CCMP736" /LENGTH=450 /DNA_ID=CAMNT_0016133967 /DNA_START=153 /DNA_END=1505 /DNA_ORIENTATION=+
MSLSASPCGSVAGCGRISLGDAIKSRYLAEPEAVPGTTVAGPSGVTVDLPSQARGSGNLLERLEHVAVRGHGVAFCEDDVSDLVPNVTELDLSDSLISSWSTVAKIIESLPKLVYLNLSSLRFTDVDGVVASGVKVSSISNLVLTRAVFRNGWTFVDAIASQLPRLELLVLYGCRGLQCVEGDMLDASLAQNLKNLKNLDIGNCNIRSVADVSFLPLLDNLETLSMSDNLITEIAPAHQPGTWSLRIKEFNMRNNPIASLASVWTLKSFSNLRILTITTENSTVTRENVIARLIQLERLNGEIEPDERIHAERKLFAELSQIPAHERAGHEIKHFEELSVKYSGSIMADPSSATLPEQSLGANMLELNLVCIVGGKKKDKTVKLPRSTTIQKLKLIYCKFFGLRPSSIGTLRSFPSTDDVLKDGCEGLSLTPESEDLLHFSLSSHSAISM